MRQTSITSNVNIYHHNLNINALGMAKNVCTLSVQKTLSAGSITAGKA